MNKSAIFKSAHALTKATVKTGDDYRATFSAALKICIADAKAPSVDFKSADDQVFDSVDQANIYADYFNANYSHVGHAIVTTHSDGLMKARFGNRPVVKIKIAKEFEFEADGWCPWSIETNDGVFEEILSPRGMKIILIERELGVL